MERLAYAFGAEQGRRSTPGRRSSHCVLDQPQRNLPAMKNSISSANDCAVANGAARVLTSAHALGRKIVPLGIGLRRRFDIRLSFGAGSGGVRMIHQMADRMEPLNPSKFPWFTRKLAHPGDLKAV
jgi:hypothetical protein